MKIIKAVELEKYHERTKYEKVNEYVYKDLSDGNFKITLLCELAENENAQYPLEDILDKYDVNCTDFFEEKVIAGKTYLTFELEGSLMEHTENYDNIMAVSSLIGKNVVNYEDGGYIKLKIE